MTIKGKKHQGIWELRIGFATSVETGKTPIKDLGTALKRTKEHTDNYLLMSITNPLTLNMLNQ